MVFEPGAIRVTQVTGSLGGPAAGPVLQATSDQQVVSIALDTAQETQVAAGDKVSVTLPGGSSHARRGRIRRHRGDQHRRAGRLGQHHDDPGDGDADRSRRGRDLDQAPVTVYITTATAKDVLAVPVTALQARPGGYVVEVTGPGQARRWGAGERRAGVRRQLRPG